MGGDYDPQYGRSWNMQIVSAIEAGNCTASPLRVPSDRCEQTILLTQLHVVYKI